MLKHKGTTVLETQRLILRRFTENDVEDMFHNWASDREVTKFLSWEPHDNIQVTKDILCPRIRSYEKEDFYYWAIMIKEERKVIGGIGAFNICNTHHRCEMGFCIGRNYWNKGIMTEALQTTIRYLFIEIGFNRIQATHHINNSASGKVMMKSGLKHEGTLKQHQMDKKGNYVDSEIYAIIKEDFTCS